MSDGRMEEATVKINRTVVHTSIKAVTGIEDLMSRKSEGNFRNFPSYIFITLEGEGVDRPS